MKTASHETQATSPTTKYTGKGMTRPPAAPVAAVMEVEVAFPPPPPSPPPDDDDDDDDVEDVVVVAKLVGVILLLLLLLVAAAAAVTSCPPPSPQRLTFVPSVTVHGDADADADADASAVAVAPAARRSNPKGRDAVMVMPNLPLSTSMPSVSESEPPS